MTWKGDTVKLYTLIAYKPDSICAHMGHRNASYSSDYIQNDGLTLEELQNRIAELKAFDHDCCEDGYEIIRWYETMPLLDLGIEFEEGITDKTCAILIECKAEKLRRAEARKFAEQAAQEKRELAEFERLRQKFNPE